MSNDRVTEQHPSYGVVRLTRMNGNIRLVGSMLDQCQHAMVLEVQAAERVIDPHLHTEHFFGRGRPIVEFYLSPHHFVELITSVGLYSGVPCTLRYVDGRPDPGPPPGKTPLEMIATHARQEGRRRLVAGEQDFRADLAELLEAIASTKMTKKASEELASKAKKLQDHASVPIAAATWASEQFARASEMAVAQAKSEIAAAVSTMVTNTGLEVLRGEQPGSLQLAPSEPKQLPPDTTRASEEHVLHFARRGDKWDGGAANGVAVSNCNSLAEAMAKMAKLLDGNEKGTT